MELSDFDENFMCRCPKCDTPSPVYFKSGRFTLKCDKCGTFDMGAYGDDCEDSIEEPEYLVEAREELKTLLKDKTKPDLDRATEIVDLFRDVFHLCGDEYPLPDVTDLVADSLKIVAKSGNSDYVPLMSDMVITYAHQIPEKNLVKLFASLYECSDDISDVCGISALIAYSLTLARKKTFKKALKVSELCISKAETLYSEDPQDGGVVLPLAYDSKSVVCRLSGEMDTAAEFLERSMHARWQFITGIVADDLGIGQYLVSLFEYECYFGAEKALPVVDEAIANLKGLNEVGVDDLRCFKLTLEVELGRADAKELKKTAESLRTMYLGPFSLMIHGRAYLTVCEKGLGNNKLLVDGFSSLATSTNDFEELRDLLRKKFDTLGKKLARVDPELYLTIGYGYLAMDLSELNMNVGPRFNRGRKQRW